MQNIIENNKLISIFMGKKESPYEFSEFGYINSKGQWKDEFLPEQLKFHKDWNWLMKVVEKIENYNEFTNVLFAPRGCAIDCYIENGFSFSNDCDTKIEAVYNACVEFIKWYNLTKNI